jgi:hypothetical protein
MGALQGCTPAESSLQLVHHLSCHTNSLSSASLSQLNPSCYHRFYAGAFYLATAYAYPERAAHCCLLAIRLPQVLDMITKLIRQTVKMSTLKDKVVSGRSTLRKMFRARGSTSRHQQHEPEDVGEGKTPGSEETIMSAAFEYDLPTTPSEQATDDLALSGPAVYDVQRIDNAQCDTSKYINTGQFIAAEDVLLCWKLGCNFCRLIFRSLGTVDHEYDPIQEGGNSFDISQASQVRIDLSSGEEPIIRIYPAYSIWEIYQPTQGMSCKNYLTS